MRAGPTQPRGRILGTAARLGESPQDGVIVTAAIAISRAFNLRVTAEGIEKEGQLYELRRLECHQAQGVLVLATLDADATGRLVRTRQTVEAAAV